ncbi:hypothetical protein KZ829_31230 [Actinoplanes hulinensis]|uniref:Uncharacterized protein n=1 Tax=Actinoplanes hulinensis TaxID=1144547 RepID=A0ABS7BAW6_9ACTN|nr:hypothetical protein [Actinoplanes hulinensis]MBW6438211.1 hypothetical protein [Actinoplanes hulinensis]
MFSLAQYEAVIGEIERGTKTFEARLAEVIPAADSASSQWYVAEVLGELLQWIARETVELGTEILNFILDVFKGTTAPIFMFMDAYKWMDLKAAANGVSADITTQNLVIDNSDWSGKGREAYLGAAAAQSAAAGRIGSIAKTTSDNLMLCAGAGLAFYIVVAGVIAKLIAEVVAATTAISTAVFSAVGAMIFLESGAVNTMAIATAVGVLAAFLGTQVNALITLHGEAVDPISFPNGVWPNSNSAQYNDGTVKDGDADWSLKD